MSAIIEYIEKLCKLKKNNGICASEPAVIKLQERIKFIKENQPFLDKALEINHMENQLFGISLSSQKIDSYDKSNVTHTCQDVLNGRCQENMVFGVDIIRVSVYITRSGESQGKKRADLVVTDSSGKMKVKVWSDVYENCIDSCIECNSIILTGKKGYGSYSDFLIATKIEQAK